MKTPISAFVMLTEKLKTNTVPRWQGEGKSLFAKLSSDNVTDSLCNY